MLGGRFMATRIEDTGITSPKKVSNLTGLFQSRVSEIAQPSDTQRSLKPKETPPEETPPTNKEIEP